MDPRWLSNAYLVADEPGGTAVFVDSGAPLGPLFDAVERERLTVTHLLTTHADADHIAGDGEIRARFAPIFVENGSFDLADIHIYDLPELIGSQTVSWPAILDNPLFASPALQPDGFSSAVLASFADVASSTMQVARINFPSDFRHVIDIFQPELRGIFPWPVRMDRHPVNHRMP